MAKVYEKHGGFALRDKELVKRLRSFGTETIKTAAQKIFKGQFNLTTLSFPIRCMSPKTVI